MVWLAAVTMRMFPLGLFVNTMFPLTTPPYDFGLAVRM